jgi:hypothetical protein
MTSFTYVGSGGEFLEGVPGRDLSDEEFAALSEQRKSDVRACGLYEEDKLAPTPPQAAAPKSSVAASATTSAITAAAVSGSGPPLVVDTSTTNDKPAATQPGSVS